MRERTERLGWGGRWLACCLTASALGVMGLVGAAERAQACEPPFTGWFVDDVVFAGESAAPVNGAVAVRLQYVEGYTSAASWPDEETVRETVSLELTRDGDEVVEGQLVIDRISREARFVADRLLAEGITYTLRVTLRNSLFEDGTGDYEESYAFTTGDGLDEAPPAFSGLQTLEVTEHAQAVQACCEAPEEQCPCSPSCQWCWTVDWEYRPKVRLTWRPVEDEYGYQTVNYLLYALDDADAEPGPEPDLVFRGDERDTIALVMRPDDPAPWCFMMVAQDIYGRVVQSGTVLCGDQDDLVPIEREAIPQPDRSGCIDSGDDVGADTGADTGGGADTATSGGDDTGEGAADASGDGGGVGDATTEVMTGDADDGCGCEVAAPGRAWPWWWCLGAALVLVGRRRREG